MGALCGFAMLQGMGGAGPSDRWRGHVRHHGCVQAIARVDDYLRLFREDTVEDVIEHNQVKSVLEVRNNG